MKLLNQFLVVLILLLPVVNTALAGEGQPVKAVFEGNLNQIQVDSFKTVTNPFHDPSYSSLVDTPYLVKNRITLKINNATPWLLQTSFSAKVRFNISAVYSGGTTSMDTSLTINYLMDSSYINESSYTFSGAHSVTVTILEVSTDAGWDVWKALLLENELQPFPLFKFSCTNDSIAAVFVESLSANTINDEIGVSWGNIASADEYDLEWTYIDSSAILSGRYGNPSSPDANLIFDNNASRVSITATSYKIPLLYDNTGALYIRVRPVQYQPGGGRSEAKWSSGADGLGKFGFRGHERKLNWQATTSFAEEGKRKSVVQYYDGSLRSRQTVTKDNSTQTTVVGESIYDYQGRPVIQVMPAPTLNNLIHYSRNFNIGADSAYDRDDFDLLNDPALYCNSGAKPMRTDSGASRYYSPSNPDNNMGISRFIPDAEGYPFTEVQYTQDNTGRISKQSGVGLAHKLGSGHETNYFYGSPDQEELDALFGTEVGDRLHYFKNMVRDANGQYSVSYVDMHGRTIATALAGIPVTKMNNMQVDSNGVLVTRRLTDSSNNIVSGTVVTSVKSLLVAVPGNHYFSYSLNADSLKIPGCDTALVCYDCLYDLRITITDDCNNQKMAFDTLVRNFSLDPLATNAAAFTFSFNKWLPEGSYEITKTLSLSKYAQDYYRDSIFIAKNTCKTIETFIEEQRQILRSQADCIATCSKCLDSLGSWQEFKTRFMRNAGIEGADTTSYEGMAMEAFKQAESDCKVLCNTKTEADDIRSSMLADVSPPSGQYAQVENMGDKYSIFYTDFEPATPVDTVANYTKPLYLDEAGNVDSVYDESAGKMVRPNKLSPEVFAQKFKSSWADALLPYHPEACKLAQLEASAIKSSYEWDTRFGTVDTYAEALTSGYLNPTDNTSSPYIKYSTNSLKKDPILLVSDYKSLLQGHLLEYRNNNIGNSSGLSLWGLATIVTMCGDASSSSACITQWGSNDSAFNASRMCTGDLDMAWRSFRQLYLEIKREIIRNKINTTCSSSVSSATLLAANHQPAFGNASEYLESSGLSYLTTDGDPVVAAQKAKDKVLAFYEDNCKSYALQWWYQLKPCKYNSTDSANIITAFINVCKEGSDENHVLGSSTVKPSSTYAFKSFEDVMKFYKSSTYDASCNAYLIPAPKPYDQQQAFANVDVWRKPDSCQCSVISGWYGKYQGSGGVDASFSAYLARVANTQISNGALDTLRQLCNNQITCAYLPKPISLPPVMQCGVKDVCVDCTTLKSLDAEFRAEWPSVVPVLLVNAQIASQVSANRLYENFMNYKLGFSKSSYEYLTFLNSCKGNTGSRLDSLQKIYEDFNASFYSYSQENNSSRFYAVDAANRVTSDSYSQIFTNGVAHIPEDAFPNKLNGYGYGYYRKDDTLCVNNEFTIEARIKKVNQDTLTSVAHIQFQYNEGNAYGLFGVILGLLPKDPNAADSAYVLNGPCCTNYMGLAHNGAGTMYHIEADSLVFADLSEWATVKFKHTVGKFEVFYNDRRIAEVPLTDTIYRIFALTNLFSHQADHGYIDYWKVYDKNGVLQYVEDYEDAKQSPSNYPLAFTCKPGWKESFITYFNGATGGEYTFSQIDSIYIVSLGYSIDSTTNGQPITKEILNSLLTQYKKTYIEPSSGFVDLEMRTFAGNITPSEGPKGVFNINGVLIGNTIDSTEHLMRESYAQIWNSDSANNNIGHLSVLANGKFRLQLHAGQLAPCDGITGMRFYQFNLATDSVYRLRTGIGTYIDFGDGEQMKVEPGNSNGTTVISENNSVTNNMYLASKTVIPDGPSLSEYIISHQYADLDIHTITIYHPDIKGVMDFTDDKPTNSLKALKNLRGYMPQQTLLFGVRGVSDSSLLSTYKIVNFNQVNSIEYLRIYVDTFFNSTNHLQSFANNSGLKYLQFVLRNNNFSTNNSNETPLSRFAPDLNVNFPNLRFLQVTGVSANNFDSINFALPKLRMLGLSYLNISNSQYDRVINQLASVNNEIGGGIQVYSIGGTGTSASDDAMNKLTTQGWGTPQPNTKIIDTIQLPVSSSFSEFVCEKLGLSLSHKEIIDLYSTTYGSIPSYCTPFISGDSNLTGPLLCGKSDPIFPALKLADITNCSDSTFFAVSKGTEYYNIYLDSLKNHFDEQYLTKCLQAYKKESFTVTRRNSEYHYTLYYYDQAGNLVKTVPPAGVDTTKFHWSISWSDSVGAARQQRQLLTPSHTLPTQYRYNTLNQVVAQQTPDAGQSHFWYDRLGRLVISQNAKQKAASGTETNRLYSYTQYDYLGRITEVGEIKNAGSTAMADTLSRRPSSLQSWLTASAANKSQITSTVYDQAYGGFTLTDPIKQRHLRNRVSYTSFTAGGNPAQYQQATFYSYDPHGNVDTLLQDYGNSTYTAAQNLMNTNGARFKKLVYRYDLISGKVNHVAYQAREADQFYHRYGYDAENRLTMAETSTDSVHWQKDARYTYYKHGPLARTVLGEDQVQGTDYAYTLQGWLKGTNSTSLSPVHDMGGDGNGPHTAGQYIARDATGFALHYYDNDYKAIGTGVTPFPGLAGYLGTDARPLYNGNISSMAVHIGALPGAVLYNYEYDRLNRITGMDMWKGFNPSGNDWTAITVSTDYKERVAYDPNGNILQYLRNTAGTTTAMDSMRYHYYAGTNRLSHIKDNAPSGIEYNDIEDQIAGNYAYDAIGNLTSDSSEHISRIDWNVYGKITGITRSTPSAGSNTRQINYRYDAAGNRIGKKTSYFGTSEVSHTWYVRDASGNVMAVYTAKKDTASSAALPDFALTLSEQHVYGSSRLGIQRRKVDMEASFIPGQVVNHTMGEKSFELSNHLGNVLTTISDRKKGVARTDSSSLISYYKADVQSAQDYYPFGMLMPGRSGYQTRGGWAQGNQTVNGTSLPELLTLESRENDMPPEYKATREVVFTGEYITGTGDEFLAYIADATNTGTGSGEGNEQGVVSGYRYGFNGKENDNEVKGEGNQIDFGARIYDPRSGKFLSPDPLSNESPEFTTYGYAYNNPIALIDVNGQKGDPIIIKSAGQTVTLNDDFTGKLTREKLQGYIDKRVREIIDVKPAPNPGKYTKWARWGIRAGFLVTFLLLPENGRETGPLKERVNKETYDEYLALFKITSQLLNQKSVDYEIITNNPSQLDDDYLSKVKERIQDGNATAQDYIYAKEVYSRNAPNAKPLDKKKESIAGIIYLRIDETGALKPYVGQAESDERYEKRQKEHSRDHPKSRFKFIILTRGKVGNDLHQKEQEGIDVFGGPNNGKGKDGKLSNKRDQRNRYKLD